MLDETKRDLDALSDDAMLEVEEVAAWLRVNAHWVRAHAKGKRRPVLPGIKVGKYWRFRKGTVRETFLQWQKQYGSAA